LSESAASNVRVIGRRSPYLGSAAAAENLRNTFARCARSVGGQIFYVKKAMRNYFAVRPRRTSLPERTHDIERNVITGRRVRIKINRMKDRRFAQLYIALLAQLRASAPANVSPCSTPPPGKCHPPTYECSTRKTRPSPSKTRARTPTVNGRENRQNMWKSRRRSGATESRTMLRVISYKDRGSVIAIWAGLTN